MESGISLRFLKPFFFVLAFVFLRHCYFLIQSFVDIPYRDSWQLIADDSFKLSWLLRPHNEHFILFSKLQVLLLYQINSWNVSFHLWTNLVIYLLALSVLFRLFKQQIVIPVIFCLCALNWENMSWEFQSCFHFFLLFLLLTVLGLKEKKYLLAIISNLFLVLSFSAGVGASLVLALLSLRINRKLSLLMALPSLLFVLGVKGASNLVLPLDLRFWDFFLNLISFGFGFETYSWLLGLFCLLLLMIPINYKEKDFLAVNGLLLAILASLAVIAVGRAGNADLHIWSKGSRYFEISSLLIPCGFVIWNDFLAKFLQANKSQLYATLFLFLPLVGTANNWDYSIYKWIGEQKTIGRECISNANQSEVYCKTLWAGESSKHISLAKKLQISFIK